MAYAYLTLAQLRTELLSRLQDSGAAFTSTAEANLYINEALRVLNAQTAQFNANYQFDFNPGDTWKSLNVSGSPRQRTLTDSNLYSQMEAMLTEPMTGGVWSGTNQFNISLLQAALQYRRDELLLQSAANIVNLTNIEAPLLATRTILPDSTIDLFRVRWLMSDSTNDLPYVLGREDVTTANAFAPQAGIQPGDPESWLITANPPLTFDTNRPPNQPGVWDILALYAGQPFVPPTATLINLPNDWAWVAMYGALADVLANSPEGRDSARAKYCLSRYEQGKRGMFKLPWLLEASVAAISVDTPSVYEMDSWLQNWEFRQPSGDPQIVVGGVDLIALAPFIPSNGVTVSSVLRLVGNAPVPTSDGDFIQLSRDGVDQVLNYAQHLASFKMGGKDFALTLPLLEQFETYCRMKNSQYAALGTFRPQMLMEGNRADILDPRFTPEEPNGKAPR